MKLARKARSAVCAAAAMSAVIGLTSVPAYPQRHAADTAQAFQTSKPIKHIVVIFQENVSFDHYFATYPLAANPGGEPKFTAQPGTPSVNGLSSALLTNNPNGFNPFRLDRTQAATCDQDHGYTAEQQAFDFGLMDAFPANVGKG